MITAAQILLGGEGLEGGDAAIVLADNNMLQALNLRYRGFDCPTDVLAFPMLEKEDREKLAAGEGGETMIGDVYISLERAHEQASAAGHSWERETLILAIHGLLHLLGHDHDCSGAAAAMQQKEVETLHLVEGHTG